LIEEDTSDIDIGNEEEKDEVFVLQRKLKILERKNHVLMGNAPNISQLSLMLSLLNI